MCVFKLERERHASARIGSNIFYVKNKSLYIFDLSGKEVQFACAVNTNGKQVMLNQPKSLYYNYFNPNTHNIILNFDGENSYFIIYEFAKDLKKVECTLEKRGDNTLGSVFVSRDRICVLELNREISTCNLDGSNLKKVALNKKGLTKIEMIYPAPLGKIIVHADDTVFLYDLTARKVLQELSLAEGTAVKQVQWSSSFSHFVIIT